MRKRILLQDIAAIKFMGLRLVVKWASKAVKRLLAQFRARRNKMSIFRRGNWESLAFVTNQWRLPECLTTAELPDLSLLNTYIKFYC